MTLQPQPDNPPVVPVASQSQGRGARARQAILEAADDVLLEDGFSAMTIEGVAARAGVAKQTIYRWWKSKVDLLMDSLLDDVDQELPPADTGSAAGDLRQHLRNLGKFLADAPAGRVLCALIGQAQHDPRVAQALRERYLDPRRDLDLRILTRAIERHEIAPGIDLDATLDALEGPVYFRVLAGGRPVDGPFIDSLVERTLRARPPDPRQP
jgi:AcrR family transcriptional regulator